MTEADWLASTDPTPMLEFLRGKASDRKCRLFAATCCRHSLLTFDYYDLEGAVNWAEDRIETADDDCPDTVREAIHWATTEPCESLNHLGMAVVMVAWEPVFDCSVARYMLTEIEMAHETSDAGPDDETRKQADLMREHFGNPFRPAGLDPAWRTPTVLALANGIYEDRAFDRLPILADALEDAGCDNADLLAHCRGEGEHVRGCWAVDLVLGKE
jgi:hypothetical protein